MSKATPEGKLKAECRAWLRAQGAYIFSPVAFGTTTTVDDLVCFKGAFIGIEYKRPDTRPKPTPRQEFIMGQIRAAGGEAIVVYELSHLKSVFYTLKETANVL